MKPYVSQQNTKLMQIAIVKYNAGNIRSVVNALQRIGCNPVITDSPEALMSADKMIRALRQPVLGICIGQQLMCRHSEEDNTDCLGIFPVDVKRFVPTDSSEKVPAMGWNNIHNLKTGLFEHVGEDDFVYFVHSYYVPVCDYTIAEADYTLPFSAALRKDNFYATQFHPEKSGSIGEQILRNFIERI